MTAYMRFDSEEEFKKALKQLQQLGEVRELKNVEEFSGAGYTPKKVLITASVLNVRMEPSILSNKKSQVCRGEVFTIVEEIADEKYIWGKLKSGAGYIAMKEGNSVYVKEIK